VTPSGVLLRLLFEALGRCRYCRRPDRCSACQSAIAKLERALRADVEQLAAGPLVDR
jgi:hypothetical protein